MKEKINLMISITELQNLLTGTSGLYSERDSCEKITNDTKFKVRLTKVKDDYEIVLGGENVAE